MESENSTNQKEYGNLSLIELEKEIKLQESNLEDLREEYIKRTGNTPTRPLNDYTWKWTVFMVLGFAFISCMVYLLGISKRGSDANTGIPPLFFKTDFAYFALLTFFVLITVIAVQSDRIVGYQAWALIFGFWCAHWLIYDWAWHAIMIGIEPRDMNTFWAAKFYAPLLIPNPPMWLFLSLALLGGVMALYTFTIPDNNRKLLPPALWLYTVYANASVCVMIGLEFIQILVVGIILVSISFSIAGFFTFKRVQEGLPEWIPSISELKERMKRENWSSDPLGLPWIFLIIIMLLCMHLFLVLLPVVGLFLGMLSWFFIPMWYIFVKSSSYSKASKSMKIFISIFYAALLVVLIVFMAYI